MLSLGLIPVVMVVAQQAPPAIVQNSSEWCSPNIANVAGNVTVNCIGVDPRALARLNAELSRKNLALTDKIREANAWTAKYKELEARLTKAGDDSTLSRQAESDLRAGELEKAGAVLDQILGKEEKEVDHIAANHFNRGLVFELQFQPLKAQPHLAKAYQYRPGEWKYGLEYGNVLRDQNNFSRAVPVLESTLDSVRRLAEGNPAAYQRGVGGVLNNLGLVYFATRRMNEAEAAYDNALAIRRELAKANPAAYEPDVAQTLNNLANLYGGTGRMKEAEDAYKETLVIRRELAKANPAAYQREVAQTLNNLAFLELTVKNLERARADVEEALSINRQLWKTNSALIGDDLAKSLLIDARVIAETQKSRSEPCSLAREAAVVAYDSEVKTLAADKQAEFCSAQ